MAGSAVLLLIGLAACQEPVRRREIAWVPSDTTIELGDVLHERIIDRSASDSVLSPATYLVDPADTNIVFVDKSAPGLRARGAGTTTIRAFLRDDPSVETHIVVHVRPSRVFFESFPSGPVEVGTTLHLTGRHTGSAYNSVFAISSNQSVVQVGARSGPSGVNMTAIAPGQSTITLIAELDTTLRATYTLTVVPATVAAITVSPATIRLHGRDDSTRVAVTLTGNPGAVLHDRTPAVTSSNPSVAGIASSAPPGFYENYTYGFYVRSGFAGSGTITIQSGDKSVAVPVSVGIAGIDSAYVNAGQSATAFVTINDAARVPAEVRSIVSPPKHGTATVSGTTSVLYTASPGFLGADTATYLVRDPSSGAIDTGVVRFNVIPGPYSRTELGNPGAYVSVTALNNRGMVAANIVYSDSTHRAARWENGQYTLLRDAVGGQPATAAAINDAGDVLGYYGSTYGYGVPILWRAGTTVPVFLFSDTTRRAYVYDINNRGQILLSTGVYENGVVTPFPTNECIRPTRLNNNGDVLAESCGDLYSNWRVFSATRGNYPGCFAGRASMGSDINDAGTVAGVAENQLAGSWNTCVWQRDVPASDLRQTYGSWLSPLNQVMRINNSGWVLTPISQGGRLTPALLISGVTVPSRVLLTDGFTSPIVSAVDLNDRGQILAYALVRDIVVVPVILSPPAGIVP